MAMREENPEHRWRLGVDARTSASEVQPSRPAVAESLPSRDVSHARLARPVYVVTVEHIAWGAIGVWAVLTRLVALGAAPMNPTGAIAALAEFAIVKDGRAALAAIPGHYASWPELLQGAVFGAISAGDARARIVVAICGLIMVKLAFATRRCVGRAGALALGAMLAISPTLTYYSRDGATAVVSMTAMLAAILIAESMRSKPGVIRGAALGVSIALWLSCDATGYASAATVAVAAACVGAFKLATHDHRRLRIRVWWQRRRAVVVVTAIVAIVGWLALTTVWFSYPVADVSAAKWRAAFALPSVAFERGLRNVIPILGFYEFAIMALAIVGAAAIVADKARSRFAA
ncbi:MAG TPA: hypothetical protein VEU51_09670, partial [Candidatus Acidoferrales bacterium]|nr:hypothetical protein [Candidatus Acidoferrales bacterium]